MRTRNTNDAMRFLERLTGGRLTLGRALEAIRLGEEESQVDFARRLGISKAHLCDIEKGRKTVSPERAARFARILGYGEKQFIRLGLQDHLSRAGLKFRVDIRAIRAA